jgi:dTDP-4-amino-4,6-dideoxygalactose transaminase
VIVSNSDEIAEKLSKQYADLKNPSRAASLKELIFLVLTSGFIDPRLYWLPAGMPFLRLGETVFHKDFATMKLGGMQAGVLRAWRERLALSNATRAETAAYFRKQLGSACAAESPIPYLRLPVLADDCEVRREILSRAQEMGLGITAMYPTSIDEIEEIKAQFGTQAFPGARVVAERLLTVPTHALLSAKDKERICNLFAGIRPVTDTATERLAATLEVGTAV